MDLETAITRCSPAVAEKGKRLFLAGKVRQDPEYPDVFWVGSGSGQIREYRVQLYQHFASCTCMHGVHTGSGATCAHPIAAMTYVKENKLDLWAKAPVEAHTEIIQTEKGTTVRRYMTGTDGEFEFEMPEEPF